MHDNLQYDGDYGYAPGERKGMRNLGVIDLCAMYIC